MGYTYRLNDDGTVQVKQNGAWLPLGEVLALKDRQLRESREEVLALEQEREAAEAEKNSAPNPETEIDADQFEEIIEYTMGGSKIIYGQAYPNSGTLTSPAGWSVPPPAKLEEPKPYPKIQVSRGGITYNVSSPEDAKDARMRGADVSYMTFDEAETAPVEERPAFIKRLKNKLDKW